MKITIQALFLLGMYSIETSYAFAPKSSPSFTHAATSSTSVPTSLHATTSTDNNNNNKNNHDDIFSFLPTTKDMKNIVTTTIMSTLLWTASPLLSSDNILSPNHNSNNNFVANAKEMASGSGSRVNKDPESLLRYGLPIPKDKEVRMIINNYREKRSE
jgi:hypothetical protein